MYIDLTTINLCPGQGGGGVKPSGTLDITENGWYDVYFYASAYAQISGYTQQEVTEGLRIDTLSNNASYIHPYVFATNSYINTVNLPNCTSVGEDAFRECPNISSVFLPVCSYIGDSGFKDCSRLQKVDIPACEFIGKSAFKGCSSLTQVTLPVCSFMDLYAFLYCSSLKRITLPSTSVCELADEGIFRGTPIERGSGGIYVTESLVDTYKSASYWSLISAQIFPIVESPISFSDGLLYGSVSEITSTYITDYGLDIVPNEVHSVSLPNCISIGGRTFFDYINLNSLYIPNCVSIGVYAFNNCALTSIDLPNCISIGGNAFKNCYLMSISAPNLETADYSIFRSNYNLSEVYLPALKNVKAGIFNGCSSLQYASLPAISEVSPNMFADCDLHSFIVVGSIIRPNAFLNNSNLSEIYIPGSQVTTIAFINGVVNAFNGTPIASGTGSIYVPWSLVDTYKEMDGWGKYASQIYPMGETPVLSFGDGVLYGATSTITKESWTALGISSADIVSIYSPNIEDTESGIFSGCTNLTSVKIPICSTIRTEAFRDCTSLSVVKLPACITIESQAFENCTGLTSLTIQTDSVCNQESAFGGTPIESGTGSIYVPYSLLEDYKAASQWSSYASQISAYDPPMIFEFDSNTGLVYGNITSIDSTYLNTLGITAEQVSAVSLPNCSSVGMGTFMSHTNLVSAYLPNCTTLSGQAFSNCQALNSITLDNCEILMSGAFRSCYGLTTISLPKATNLYGACFFNCSNLSEIWLMGSSIVTLSYANAFNSCPATVIVPSSLYDSYLAAPVWSSISSRLLSH